MGIFQNELAGLDGFEEFYQAEDLDDLLNSVEGVADVMENMSPETAGPFRKLRNKVRAKRGMVAIPKSTLRTIINKLKRQTQLTHDFRQAGITSELGLATTSTQAGDATFQLTKNIQAANMVGRYIALEATAPCVFTNVKLGTNIAAEAVVHDGGQRVLIPIPLGSKIGQSTELSCTVRGAAANGDKLDAAIKVGFGPLASAR